MVIGYLFLVSIVVFNVQGQQKALSVYRYTDRQEFELAQAAFANFNRAEDYYVGTPTVAQDYVQARELYELVAGQTAYAPAQAWAWFHLGEIYAHGQGVPRNYSKARRYFELASDQPSNMQAVAYASFRLGEIYYFGAGVAKNNEKAEECFEEAEEHAAEDLADIVEIRQAVVLYFNAIYETSSELE